MEEVGELIEASVIDDEYSDFESQTHAVKKEALDVVVTVMGLLQAHGVTWEYVEWTANEVAKKNDAKTLDTHELVNGKITRKAN